MGSSKKKRSANAEDTPTKNVRRKIFETPEYGIDFVAIEVGDEEEKASFTAHKNLLSTHSEFFRAATSKDWKEGQENKVLLEEEDPEIFRIFHSFIYSGQIYSSRDGDFSEAKGTQLTRDKEWSRLIRAWLLGEKLMSISFKDAIVDAIITKNTTTDQVPVGMHRDLYPETGKTAKVRKLLIDMTVFSGVGLDHLTADEPSEFLLDLAVRLYKTATKQENRSAPWRLDCTCDYHEHGKEGACYKEMF